MLRVDSQRASVHAFGISGLLLVLEEHAEVEAGCDVSRIGIEGKPVGALSGCDVAHAREEEVAVAAQHVDSAAGIGDVR